MSAEIDYRALAQEWLKEVNKHNVSAFDSYLTSNFVEHEEVPGTENLSGADVPKAYFGMMFEAFPDVHMELMDMTVDGDKLWWRYRLTGTNTGPFMGMPPTGKKIDIQGIDVLRMEGDRAAEHWGVTDELKMMQQLGLVPDMASA